MSEKIVSDGHDSYRVVSSSYEPFWTTLYWECNGKQEQILFRDEHLLELLICALKQTLADKK